MVSSKPKAIKRYIKPLEEATPMQATVIAELVAGASQTSLKKKYGVGDSTIARWAKQFGIERYVIPEGAQKPVPNKVMAVELHKTVRKQLPKSVQKLEPPSYSNLDANGDVKPMGEQILDYLGNIFYTLNVQSELARNPQWLEKQDASGLASLHRVLGDRGVELFSAFIRGQSQPSEDEED